MASSVFTLNVALNSGLIARIEEALAYRQRGLNPRGPTSGCRAMEKAEADRGLSLLRTQLPSGMGCLDIFAWDVILAELARLCVGKNFEDAELINTCMFLRGTMHADPRYMALLKQGQEYEKRQRKLERLRRRHQRDSEILSKYDRTANLHGSFVASRDLT